MHESEYISKNVVREMIIFRILQLTLADKLVTEQRDLCQIFLLYHKIRKRSWWQ